MREGVKALLSVIRAHSAGTDTAKAKITAGKMDDGVIDTAAAELNARSDFLYGRLMAGEQVKGQWTRLAVDKRNQRI